MPDNQSVWFMIRIPNSCWGAFHYFPMDKVAGMSIGEVMFYTWHDPKPKITFSLWNLLWSDLKTSCLTHLSYQTSSIFLELYVNRKEHLFLHIFRPMSLNEMKLWDQFSKFSMNHDAWRKKPMKHEAWTMTIHSVIWYIDVSVPCTNFITVIKCWQKIPKLTFYILMIQKAQIFIDIN